MFIYKLLIIAIIFITLDYTYINFISSYFSNQVQIIQGSTLNIDYIATIISYIFLIFGINYFIIQPKRSIQDAFLLGLIIYAVFETTNKALFSKWSWYTVIIDTLWGGILFALTTYIVNTL